MLSITRWAGHHPWLVRLLILPILIYFHSRLAFIWGAELYFDHFQMGETWLWSLVGLLFLLTWIYPDNARELLSQRYWQLKSLTLLSCMTAFGLWVYIGNQAAATYYEPSPSAARIEQSVKGRIVEEANMSISTNSERGFFAPVRRGIRAYFKAAIAQIREAKERRRGTAEGFPKGLAIALGVIGLAVGIAVLVCSIGCGSTGGAIALGVIGGVALIGLGIWALVAGLRRQRPTAAAP